MAIIGPNELPAVLRVRSDPMKKYVLSQLGHPNVEVEVTEDQWEVALRTVGDWIAGYFPREQRLGMFYTSPLKSTYPLPRDAYWVQEVAWDPLTTNINDVFGAEAYLFCVSPSMRVLARDGSMQPVGDWMPHWLAKTPYGNGKLTIKRHENKRLLPKVRLIYDGGVVEATSNHILAIPPSPPAAQRWREFGEVGSGDSLCGPRCDHIIQVFEAFESVDAIAPRSAHGCYYGCLEGEPVLLH